MGKKPLPNNKIVPFDIVEEYTNPETSKYHILSVPYAETVSYLKGTENAPMAILKASNQVELYDPETESEPFINGISLKEIAVNIDIQHIWNNIGKEVLLCIKAGKFPILLGGEHSITFGAIRAARILLPDTCLVQIDAHADLREEYMDSPFNHACAMRHAFNTNIPVVQIGIRSLCREEHELINDNPDLLTTFFASAEELNINEIIKSIKAKNVYLSIDLDGFDPSVIPHVGTPEPGGLGWYQGLSIIKAIFNNFNVIGADIVELAPNKYSTISDFTTAKLLYKLMCYKN